MNEINVTFIIQYNSYSKYSWFLVLLFVNNAFRIASKMNLFFFRKVSSNFKLNLLFLIFVIYFCNVCNLLKITIYLSDRTGVISNEILNYSLIYSVC